jgi:tetratricopeptide (TPR) repeat protein
MMMMGVLMATLLASPVDDILQLVQEGRLSDAAAQTQSARLDPVDRDQLLGYLALRDRDFDRAVRFFERVLSREPDRASAWLYMGLALHRQGRHRESLAALDRAAPSAVGLAEFHTLRARSTRLTENATAAWAHIQTGLRRFESDPGLLREQVSLLLEVGAVATARRRAEQLFAVTPHPLDDRLWLARVLVNLGVVEEAAPVLEEAIALSATGQSASDAAPSTAELRAQLAWIYARLGRPYAAARLIDPSNSGSRAYAYEAADQWRVAGETARALAANRFVEDADRRRAQRLLILVEAGELERAAALGGVLDANTLDVATTYALAFAFVHTGRASAAKKLFERFDDDETPPGLEALRAQIAAALGDDEK